MPPQMESGAGARIQIGVGARLLKCTSDTDRRWSSAAKDTSDAVRRWSSDAKRTPLHWKHFEPEVWRKK